VAGPKQVEIESKFVEITQNNLKELGFDWLLGPFNITGNSGKIVGAGGAPPPADQANFPFSTANQFPVTSGNRSGDFAITANAIDALLLGTGGASVAPGIFGLAGVMTNPQFQVVIRALNQKKGIDLLSAPRVTTKSGQRAVIEIVREFRYATQFSPPQVPTFSGGGSGTTVAPAVVTPVVVSPTTPTKFDTRNTGVTLEVEPVVGADGAIIDLNLVPQVVEFEGFINYGSPIFGLTPPVTGTTTFTDPITGVISSITQLISPPKSLVLTENVINQPIFSTRKVTTSVQVANGQTVVIGGLMREDVQKVEDKTPLLGDIPLVGRLF